MFAIVVMRLRLAALRRHSLKSIRNVTSKVFRLVVHNRMVLFAEVVQVVVLVAQAMTASSVQNVASHQVKNALLVQLEPRSSVVIKGKDVVAVVALNSAQSVVEG